MVREPLTRYVAPAVLIVILGGAAYEAAVALQWIPVGTVPGESARFEGFFMASAYLAILAGIVISLVLAEQDRRSVPAALFAIAAGALMVARYYTFDTYNLPTLIRYVDEEAFSPGWVYSVAILGVLASFVSVLRPRFGFIVTAVVLFLCAFTSIFFGSGH